MTKLLSIIFYLIFAICPLTQAQNSVLSEGRWYKIGITKTAIYRLDVAFFKQLGINPTDINPKNLRLYGNGGAMLSQHNNTSRATDLIENAILVKGEADGRFDEGDALWFFGESPHQIRYNPTEKRLQHQLNLYSDTTFYYLQIGSKAGLRIQSQAAGNSGPIVATFDDYVYQESENYNRVQSGREWWGEYFGSQTRQDFNVDLNGIVADGSFKVTVASVAAAQVTTKFLVSVNGQNVGEQTMGTVSTFRYDSKGQRTQKTYEGKLSNITNNRITTTFTFDKAGQVNADGYLDFFGLQVQRALRLYDQTTVFQNISSTSQDSVRYSIGQANTQMQLWDITNPLRPVAQAFRLNGTDANFGSEGKTLKRFVIFTESQLQAPISAEFIANQNIRALSTPHLLIVTAPFWQKQAQKLAEFRHQNDGLEVAVVTTSQLYNEFSSGQTDPTAIRDFAKYLYQKQSNKLNYLLLFGDANYDYKNNLKALSPLEMAYFVPTYESRESGHPVLSFSSDDYFGFLKPEDGDWGEDFNGNHLLDIGVGRLPVKSVAEAEAVVNKLMRYNTKRSRGAWRQRIAFVADDGDANLHQLDADNLSKIVAKTTSTYDLRKVYVDAFPQIGTNSVRAPAVNQAIDRYVNEGVLMMNYTGHGGTSIWADEQILTLQNLFNWRNLDNMPLVITATCEFGRYDNPAEVSGAEIAVLSPRGGAIAMLTTARPVYASTNFLLNEAFYDAAFQPQNGQMPRLGDLIKVTKNNSFSGVFNRNFTLLGDPSLRLNYPDYDINITTNDTLKAGSLVRFEGNIKQADKLAADFNGTALVHVYDKENQLVTLGHDDSKMNYGQYESKLFEGQVSVKQGKFSVAFVVPKGIAPKLGNGLVQVYAVRLDSLADAAGGNNKIWVGGEKTTNDIKPPTLTMYLNDESFVEGSQVEDSPVLIAKLTDENGLNLLEDMTLTLNDTFSVKVNAYFLADKDNYQQGIIRFPFSKLSAGEYILRLKVADTYNNWTEGTLRFRVGNQVRLVEQILAFPNPFIDQFKLQVVLVNEGEDIETEVQIFDLNGQRLHASSRTYYNSDKTVEAFRSDEINQTAQIFPAGIYVYKVLVHSITRQHTQIVGGKLIKPK